MEHLFVVEEDIGVDPLQLLEDIGELANGTDMITKGQGGYRHFDHSL